MDRVASTAGHSSEGFKFGAVEPSVGRLSAWLDQNALSFCLMNRSTRGFEHSPITSTLVMSRDMCCLRTSVSARPRDLCPVVPPN
jgi:hypothetical protein